MVHESARLKVKGLSFIPKALQDESKSKCCGLLESVADLGTEL